MHVLLLRDFEVFVLGVTYKIVSLNHEYFDINMPLHE